MRLIIGTAQFGMKYGVAGGGNFNQQKLTKFLSMAVANNINTIDTLDIRMRI